MKKTYKYIIGFSFVIVFVLFNISNLAAQNCHVGILKSVDNNDVNFSLDIDGDDMTLVDVIWKDQNHNTICTNQQISINLNSNIVLVCAEYSVQLEDNTNCNNTTCTYVDANDCVEEDFMVPFAFCEQGFEPVCGCNGVTYANACEAEKYFGVTQYSFGPCPNAVNSTPITNLAYFYTHNLGNNDFEFQNLSSCDDAYFIWDFGDGAISVVDSNENMTHLYEDDDVYSVKLTKVNATGDIESFSSFALSSAVDDYCDINNGCVWPGDTDGDTYANMYDVLYLGIANAEEGGYRPNAVTEWSEQVGPVWNLDVNGIDGRYMDANGDGIIGSSDITVIDNNYSFISDVTCSNYNPSATPISLVFDDSEIIVTDDSPELITIGADVIMGDNTNIAQDIFGLAFKLEYEDEFVAEHVMFDYSNQSFLGSTNEIFTFQKEYLDVGNVDIALTRNQGGNQSGYGVLGRVEWIIESDIIAGRASADFEGKISGVKVINKNGETIDVNPVLGVVTFIDSTSTTGTHDPNLVNAINIFPNPAKDQLQIQLSKDVKIINARLFDAQGNLLLEKQVNNQSANLDVSAYANGFYMVEIQTDYGTYNQKIVISK